MKRTLAMAALALSSLTSPGHAQVLHTAKVSYADLDLSSAKGRAALNRRIGRAIDELCGEQPPPVGLFMSGGYFRCRDAARASADQQLAAIYRGEQLADSAVKLEPGR